LDFPWIWCGNIEPIDYYYCYFLSNRMLNAKNSIEWAVKLVKQISVRLNLSYDALFS